MYNGLEAAKVKGTGLSGYVQRSKASAVSGGLSQFNEVGEEGSLGGTSNPLRERRSHAENEELDRQLAVHKSLREVHLQVFLYREDRAAQGIDAATVDRECAELYQALMAAVESARRTETKAEQQKSAARFAASMEAQERGQRRTGDAPKMHITEDGAKRVRTERPE